MVWNLKKGFQIFQKNGILLIIKIKEKFPEALYVDMESNSIAHVCAKMNKPFVSLRIISDTPWVEDHAEQYANFWTDAPVKNFELLKNILQAL